MENFRIENNSTGGYIVFADDERFGDNAIVFEGIKIEECIHYIARNNISEALKVLYEMYRSYDLARDENGKITIMHLMLKVTKSEQLEKFEACLIHLFSGVCVEINVYESDKEFYFKVSNSVYSLCLGFNIKTGEIVRKNKRMNHIEHINNTPFDSYINENITKVILLNSIEEREIKNDKNYLIDLSNRLKVEFDCTYLLDRYNII